MQCERAKDEARITRSCPLPLDGMVMGVLLLKTSFKPHLVYDLMWEMGGVYRHQARKRWRLMAHIIQAASGGTDDDGGA